MKGIDYEFPKPTDQELTDYLVAVAAGDNIPGFRLDDGIERGLFSEEAVSTVRDMYGRVQTRRVLERVGAGLEFPVDRRDQLQRACDDGYCTQDQIDAATRGFEDASSLSHYRSLEERGPNMHTHPLEGSLSEILARGVDRGLFTQQQVDDKISAYEAAHPR